METETKHTTESWDAMDHFTAGVHDGKIIVDQNGAGVVTVWWNNALLEPDKDAGQRDLDNRVRIATLISAAPDLLAACKALLAEADDIDHPTDNCTCPLCSARAAIAKAEGK